MLSAGLKIRRQQPGLGGESESLTKPLQIQLLVLLVRRVGQKHGGDESLQGTFLTLSPRSYCHKRPATSLTILAGETAEEVFAKPRVPAAHVN